MIEKDVLISFLRLLERDGKRKGTLWKRIHSDHVKLIPHVVRGTYTVYGTQHNIS